MKKRRCKWYPHNIRDVDLTLMEKCLDHGGDTAVVNSTCPTCEALDAAYEIPHTYKAPPRVK